MSAIVMDLRYKGNDKFGNSIFIVSSKIEEEVEAYHKLLHIESRLKGSTSTFLPVFSNSNHNYATIRFKYHKGELHERALYTVEFVVKEIMRDDRFYFNCFINKIKLKSKAFDGDALKFVF
jgi:hypothetical protein